ncbi:MAG: flagellar basal body-associated FliL family protein [Pseudomonadota bacterium]
MALESFDDTAPVRSRKRGGGMGKIIAAIVMAFFLALGAVGVFFYFQGLLDPYLRLLGLISDEPTIEELQTTDVIYDFPIMIVTLLDDRGRRLQMLIEMRFVLADESEIEVIETNQPALEDVFNYYLREVRLSDVRDRQLMERLRSVVLDEVNGVLRQTSGVTVKDLLFMDLAMQQER